MDQQQTKQWTKVLSENGQWTNQLKLINQTKLNKTLRVIQKFID